MDSHQHEALSRMFRTMRLAPWIPEHEIFIKAEIAKLELLDPHDAKSFKEFYTKKLAEYVTANAPDIEVKEEPKKEEIKVEEIKIEEPKVEKKKPGRKPKVP